MVDKSLLPTDQRVEVAMKEWPSSPAYPHVMDPETGQVPSQAARLRWVAERLRRGVENTDVPDLAYVAMKAGTLRELASAVRRMAWQLERGNSEHAMPEGTGHWLDDTFGRDA